MFGLGKLGRYNGINLVGELQTTVARITMAEFHSETEANTFEQIYAQVAPPALPEAKSLIMIRTGPTSGMSVAIYPDEETAESILEARKEMLSRFNGTFKDIWHMQGDVSLNHVNP